MGTARPLPVGYTAVRAPCIRGHGKSFRRMLLRVSVLHGGGVLGESVELAPLGRQTVVRHLIARSGAENW